MVLPEITYTAFLVLWRKKWSNVTLCEPTCNTCQGHTHKSLQMVNGYLQFDYDPCDLWPWPMWTSTSRSYAKVMNFFSIGLFSSDFWYSDRWTDRKRCIRAYRALGQVGSNKKSMRVFYIYLRHIPTQLMHGKWYRVAKQSENWGQLNLDHVTFNPHISLIRLWNNDTQNRNQSKKKKKSMRLFCTCLRDVPTQLMHGKRYRVAQQSEHWYHLNWDHVAFNPHNSLIRLWNMATQQKVLRS